MNTFFSAALEIQSFIESQNWDFCFIGGVAVLGRGEIRMTQDLDITLLTGFGNEKIFIKKLLSNFETRISGAEEFAMENRIILIKSSNGVPIDISLGGIDFEKEMIKRADYFEFLPQCSLKICSAEDLIVQKAFAGREKDWMDIKGIIIKQKELNWEYIILQLEPLCEIKGGQKVMDKLLKLKIKAF